MPFFRKKPVVVEARQWDGTAEGATLIIDWILATGTRTASYSEGDHVFDPWLRVETLEGTMRALKDDWIIRGVQDEFYPCKPDIFEETYEQVELGIIGITEKGREALRTGKEPDANV